MIDLIIGEPGTLATFVALVILLFSALWAEWYFRRFPKLPMHYDWRGRSTRLGHRSWAIWLPTGVMISVIAATGLLMPHIYLRHAYGPPDQDPSWDLVWSSTAIVIAQGFVLWLHARWARSQA